MNDFLSRLAARTLGLAPLVSASVPGWFTPSPEGAEDGLVTDELLVPRRSRPGEGWDQEPSTLPEADERGLDDPPPKRERQDVSQLPRPGLAGKSAREAARPVPQRAEQPQPELPSSQDHPQSASPSIASIDAVAEGRTLSPPLFIDYLDPAPTRAAPIPEGQRPFAPLLPPQNKRSRPVSGSAIEDSQLAAKAGSSTPSLVERTERPEVGVEETETTRAARSSPPSLVERTGPSPESHSDETPAEPVAAGPRSPSPRTERREQPPASDFTPLVPMPAQAPSIPPPIPRPAESERPIVRITIGRVEVRAEVAAPPQPKAPRRKEEPPRVSLQDYLRRGGAGGRG